MPSPVEPYMKFVVQLPNRQKFSWFISNPIKYWTTTTPLLLSSLSLLRIYRQSYHGLLTLFAQMTIAAAILQTTLLSYCGKRLDVAYIFWISWRKKEKTLKDRSLYLSACTLGLTQWNLSCFEFKFDDTRLSSWYKNKIQNYFGFIVLIQIHIQRI